MKYLKLTLVTLLLCAFGYLLVAIMPKSTIPLTTHNSAVEKEPMQNTHVNVPIIDERKYPVQSQRTTNIDKPPLKNMAPQPSAYIPPITQSPTPMHYTGDLHDHEAYKQYHTNQERELKIAFTDASKQKIMRLEALIARGIKEGISQDEIAFAKEKVSGLKAMNKQLQDELNMQN